METARRVLVTFGLVVWMACGAQPVRKDDAPTATTSDAGPVDAGPVDRGPGVWLHVTPIDATIVIDGEPRGTARDLEADGGFLALPAGLHQIVVQREGYRTWRAEVTVRENTEPIQVELEAAASQPAE